VNRTLPLWWNTPRHHGSSGVGVGTRTTGESEVLAVHPMKTYGRECGGTTPRILNVCTSDSSVCPHISLYPGVVVEGKIPHCPLNRSLGGPQSLFESVGEDVNLLPQPRIQPGFPGRPVLNRVTTASTQSRLDSKRTEILSVFSPGVTRGGLIMSYTQNKEWNTLGNFV
jgi:hypothetical protein